VEAIKTPADSLFAFVVRVTEGFPKFIQIVENSPEPQFIVPNPVNPNENFSEKWNAEHYRQFRSWHLQLLTVFEKLRDSRGMGVDVMLNRLGQSFGNEPVLKAAKALGTDTDALLRAGKLHVGKTYGSVGAVGALIPRTTYYGA